MSQRPVRIACFGDSLTEGYGLRPDEALPAVLERMLNEQGLPTSCLNFGVSGDTSMDGVVRLQHVLDSQPDAVILEFGANDCFVNEPIEAVIANLSTIIEKLQEHNIPILLMGVSAIPESGPDYKQAFDPLFRDLAERYSLLLLPDILACYFDDSSLTLMDGMHPNAQGVKAIARALSPQVKTLMEQTGRKD